MVVPALARRHLFRLVGHPIVGGEKLPQLQCHLRNPRPSGEVCDQVNQGDLDEVEALVLYLVGLRGEPGRLVDDSNDSVLAFNLQEAASYVKRGVVLRERDEPDFVTWLRRHGERRS